MVNPALDRTNKSFKVSTMRFIDELETRYYLNLFIFLKQLGFIEYDVLLNIEYY